MNLLGIRLYAREATSRIRQACAAQSESKIPARALDRSFIFHSSPPPPLQLPLVAARRLLWFEPISSGRLVPLEQVQVHCLHFAPHHCPAKASECSSASARLACDKNDNKFCQQKLPTTCSVSLEANERARLSPREKKTAPLLESTWWFHSEFLQNFSLQVGAQVTQEGCSQFIDETLCLFKAFRTLVAESRCLKSGVYWKLNSCEFAALERRKKEAKQSSRWLRMSGVAEKKGGQVAVEFALLARGQRRAQ